jgi:hypothetical protein
MIKTHEIKSVSIQEDDVQTKTKKKGLTVVSLQWSSCQLFHQFLNYLTPWSQYTADTPPVVGKTKNTAKYNKMVETDI